MTEIAKAAEDEGCLLFIMIDTCVWLDLAKDYRQRATIGALEELIKAGVVELLVPQLVVDEFERNKDRVIKESGQSLASTFRRVREAVHQFGKPEGRKEALAQLGDVDHRIAVLGEAVNDSIGRIEKLFAGSKKIVTSDAALLGAALRAVDKRAPFHKAKNSVGDAILIELYAAAVEDDKGDGNNYAFVTHNKHDFSSATGDERMPHPDIADLFRENSSYSINLNAYLNEMAPEWIEELQAEYEFEDEPRRLSELLEEEQKLSRQVWYNRHWGRRIAIEEGRIKVLPEAQYSRSPYKPDEILDTIWKGALEAAKRTEDELGLENLGPWDDFEWGMINGKLSAIRWMLGFEWDMLDT
ncbi:PIN domain-containing protein [Pseudomonas sp. NPDC086112]|uniref:PIN domain-containing protein n=1 Tax=Pseudomonas sp. NPDC086112 TaxID=3364430 RepID=UPI003813375E